MRILLACALLACCASRNRETPAAAATVMAGSMPPSAPAPETTPEAGPVEAKPVVPGAPPSAAPANSGAMTAAEAAAKSAQGAAAAKSSDGAASAKSAEGAVAAKSAEGAVAARSSEGDDAACATDADCTFTRVAPGACCPMLCAPRAVTKKAADALDEHVKSCAKGHECPLPSCRPPRQMTTPACVQSRCVAKVRDEKGMQ